MSSAAIALNSRGCQRDNIRLAITFSIRTKSTTQIPITITSWIFSSNRRKISWILVYNTSTAIAKIKVFSKKYLNFTGENTAAGYRQDGKQTRENHLKFRSLSGTSPRQGPSRTSPDIFQVRTLQEAGLLHQPDAYCMNALRSGEAVIFRHGHDRRKQCEKLFLVDLPDEPRDVLAQLFHRVDPFLIGLDIAGL